MVADMVAVATNGSCNNVENLTAFSCSIFVRRSEPLSNMSPMAVRSAGDRRVTHRFGITWFVPVRYEVPTI